MSFFKYALAASILSFGLGMSPPASAADFQSVGEIRERKDAQSLADEVLSNIERMQTLDQEVEATKRYVEILKSLRAKRHELPFWKRFQAYR